MLADNERERANQIQARMRAEIQAAENHPDLTRRARDRLRAKAVLKAKAAMQELRTASDKFHEAETARAYRAAFGLRPDRAAEDRAYRDKLAASPPNAGEAQRMFALAEARGDELAMTALAELAWHNRSELGGHWGTVLDQFGAISPGNERALANLMIFVQPDKREMLADKIATEIIPPRDLPGNLEALAAEPSRPTR